MRYKIPYDGASVEIDLPKSAVVLEAKNPKLIADDVLRDRIASCIIRFPHASRKQKTVIVVNDATRRLPTPKIIGILTELIPISDATVLIATGTHRAPKDSEIDTILGDTRSFFEKRIIVHDCYDKESMDYLGETSRGTPVWVNKEILKAERIICINSVEPHFFAGFTGGRKSLIPGLAGFETTVANHSHAKHEDAKSLNLATNPVHLDLEEAVSLIKNKGIFSVQLVTSRQGGIISEHCGELTDSFQAACQSARNVYTIAIKNKYDIVVAVGEPPLDINLYQLQKGQEHGAEAVKDGGILIVAGACSEGTGSNFFMRLAGDYPTPDAALSVNAMDDNRFGIHKLVKTARRLQKIKIWYVTKLDDRDIAKVYYIPKRSLQEALDEALQVKGPGAKVAILRDACFIVPIVNNS